MSIEDTVFQLDFKCFSIYFWNKFYRIYIAKLSSTDLVWLLQVPDQNERLRLIKQGWSDDQPWPSKTHALPYMVYGLDLQTSQLLCPSPVLNSADWPWPSDVQIGKCKGVCQHIYSPRAQTAPKTMEISINTHHGSRWQRNTIPMVWSTFQVQMW